jgi:hypothetical protein
MRVGECYIWAIRIEVKPISSTYTLDTDIRDFFEILVVSSTLEKWERPIRHSVFPYVGYLHFVRLRGGEHDTRVYNGQCPLCPK